MRYILIKDNVTRKEIISRQKYLFDIFKVYFIPYYRENYIELISIPNNCYNIIFIYGHNNLVLNYLKNNIVNENTIVLITCYTGLITKFIIKNKILFYSDNITNLSCGKDYGFDFDISDSELNLYNFNNNNKIYDRINNTFNRKET